MATRNPAGSGPGRGTPRTRTAARPGERAHRHRRPETVRHDEETEGIEHPPAHRRLPAAGAITWRLVVLVVAVLGVGIVLAQSLRIYFVQSAEIARTREEIAHSKELIAKQRDELARWEDPDYVRSQARVRLGWVMPGEIGYRVIGPDGKPIDGSESVAQSAEETAGPWFDRMWTSVKVADEPVPTPAPSAKSGPDVIIGASPSPSDPHS